MWLQYAQYPHNEKSPYNTGLAYKSVIRCWGYDKKIPLPTCKEFVQIMYYNRSSKF